MNETNGKQTVNYNRLFEAMTQNMGSLRQLPAMFQSLQLGLDGSLSKIFDACHYPLQENVDPEFYRSLYDREPVANRVCNLMPNESWQHTPTIYEDESTDKVTPFEDDWDQVGIGLQPNGKSWYQDEAGSIIWEYLKRADILSGIGQFGIILFGLDDGRNLQDPVDGVEVLKVNSQGKRIGTGLRTPWCRFPDSPVSKFEKEQRGKDQETLNRRYAELVGNKAPPRWYVGDDMQGPAELSPDGQPPKDLRDMAAKAGQVNVNARTGSSGVPGDGPFIQGTDASYSWMSGMGMAPPFGVSLSGTDQQYFGVQFGPSQAFSDKPSTKKHKLMFLRCFSEDLVQVVRYEWNISNPRFGLPVMYRVTLNDPRQPHSGIGLPLATVYVHWSRVIHLADNLVVSEIFGAPRMRDCLNPILDVIKVRGASAEGYWQAAFSFLHLSTNPSLGADAGDVELDIPKIKEDVQAMFAGLERWMATKGMSAEMLSPEVSDPKTQIDVQIEAICIAKKCPIRVFKGSERGELASTQDDEDWNGRRDERRKNYNTAKIICPVVDRLIQVGVLSEPEGYSAKWPDLDALGDKDRAGIALQKTQAIAAYAGPGNCEAVMPPQAFFTEVMNMDEDTVEEFLDDAKKATQDDMHTIPPPGEDGHPATPPPPPPKVVMPGAGGKPGGVPAAAPGGKPPSTAQPGKTAAPSPAGGKP